MRKEDAAMKQEIINKALNNDGDIFLLFNMIIVVSHSGLML